MPNYQVPNAPSWWKPMGAKNSANKENTPYDRIANALIPYLSPENQRAVGSYLGNQKDMSSYRNAPYAPTVPGNAASNAYYMSSQRAQQALAALHNLRLDNISTTTTTGRGKKKTSTTAQNPGIQYIQQVLNTMQRLGGSGGQMTRAHYEELVNAIQGLNTQVLSGVNAKEIKPFTALTNYLVAPTVSTGEQPGARTKTQSGRTIYGTPNSGLFV